MTLLNFHAKSIEFTISIVFENKKLVTITQTCKQEYASTLGQIVRISKVTASKQTWHMQNIKYSFWDIGWNTSP